MNAKLNLLGWLLKAHPRIHPTDLTPEKARERMRAECDSTTTSPKNKLKVFDKICTQFRPVFRFFFFEKFIDAESWFSSRLRYVRSVASTSMAGYTLGLGDRHAQNILMDDSNGEIIHIDLGIAFDLGRILPTPEMVPFRLTRDIVDAMGCTGVDGTFRRCSQYMLETLRQESKNLLMILEVLRHDPLYMWTLSPMHAKKHLRTNNDHDPDSIHDISTRNSKGGAKSNKDADRALLGVRTKLSTDVSVECQVNELIAEASSKEHLAQMFHGWQAWL